MTNRIWARLVEFLSLDVLNKGNKRSEQFSVKLNIRVREVDDVKQGGKKNLAKQLGIPSVICVFKNCKSFSSFRWCVYRVSQKNLDLLQVLLRNFKLKKNLKLSNSLHESSSTRNNVNKSL